MKIGSGGWVVVEIDDPLLFQTTRFLPYYALPGHPLRRCPRSSGSPHCPRRHRGDLLGQTLRRRQRPLRRGQGYSARRGLRAGDLADPGRSHPAAVGGGRDGADDLRGRPGRARGGAVGLGPRAGRVAADVGAAAHSSPAGSRGGDTGASRGHRADPGLGDLQERRGRRGRVRPHRRLHRGHHRDLPLHGHGERGEQPLTPLSCLSSRRCAA